jgi:thiamine pyrophosphate-dependent acetolactate synthase large subunit-like protein
VGAVKPAEAVAGALDETPDALFVSSLGTATSALRLASDDGPHLYLGGAMGCGLAVSLGVAEARRDPGAEVGTP